MSTFNIKADFTNGVKIEGGFITFVQQDTKTCELSLELLDKGNIIDMTNRRATFSVVTPSGATIEETHLEVVDATLGKLKLVMPSDMILESGKYKAQIQLYPLESYARESTLIFNYSVTPSLMSDQKLLATERFGTLEGLIVTVEGLQNDVNGNVETIEKAQVVAERAKDDALLSASYSIQSATSAKEAAQAATTMTGVLDEVVEQARQSALASTESAQAAKASADEADRAAKTALAATDKANTAVSTANKALADVNTAIVDITTAKQVIDNAAITANNAANEATNAVTQTNQLSQTVHALADKVNTANQTANSNLQAIDIIANKADSAAGKAEASLTKADEVSKKVDAALVVAEGVVAQANTANLTANKAVVDATNQANIAKGEVTKATEQANKAKTEADRATTQANTASGHADKAKEEADKAGLAGEQAFKDGIHLNGVSKQNFNFIGVPARHPRVAYGIRVDLRDNTVTRLGGAVGMEFKDFMNVAPWNGKLVNIEGQYMKEFELTYTKRVPILLEPCADGGKGQQMVVWEDWVSCYPFEDMDVAQTFVRGGKVVPYYYFSRFEGSIQKSDGSYLLNDEQTADFNNDMLSSIPNAKPCSGKTQNLTIENARKLANNRNKNSEYEWSQLDFSFTSYMQRLLVVAMGGFDCQATIGRGTVDIPDNPNTENNSLKTGGTLNMGLLCGSCGENGKSSVNAWGIENFWGNIWKFVDDFVIEAKGLNNGFTSGGDNLTVNTSSNKDDLGYTLSKSNGYASAFGYDKTVDFAYIPTVTKSGKVISKDYFYQNNTYSGFLVARLGGFWSNGSYAGCFYWRVSYAASSRIRSVGARLACIRKSHN
ncbi:MAG: BppU family phage baseplate upper protein [Sarcina sp.]